MFTEPRPTWSLHPQLARDTINIGDLPLSRVLMTEIARVARALKAVTACTKLNIAALGNIVPQLHVHVIARREGDTGWPRPIWGAAPALPQDRHEIDPFISTLRRKIWIG